MHTAIPEYIPIDDAGFFRVRSRETMYRFAASFDELQRQLFVACVEHAIPVVGE
jgi:hypothetical protein